MTNLIYKADPLKIQLNLYKSLQEIEIDRT